PDPSLPCPGPVVMESSSVASASSEAGSTRSQEIEELERFIDSYVLEYQVQGLLSDKNDNDPDGEKTQSNVSQWTEDCSDKIDGSWSSSRGRGSSKPDEWEHSSNGSTGSRPSSGSRPGSGSRSGSRGRNNQFCVPSKNGNRDGSFDILGTDIWAANTMDSHGSATWDLQPEKLDFSQFHRKQFRGTPKHLPHIDREGMMKGKFDDDGINLNDMEKFLPGLPVFPPLPNEAEIAHTKKLFRRRRNDRRVKYKEQVQRIKKRFEETGDVFDKPRSGRPHKTTAREERLLVRKSKASPSSTAAELHQAWSPQVPVSTRTVCRILSRNGLHGRISAQKPALNKRQVKNRVAFAKAHSLLNGWTLEKWQKVDFSDESSVELHHSHRKYCRRPTGARMDPRFTQKTVKFGGGKIMVWGYIQYGGVRNFVGQILQQDGAPSHTSISTSKFLKAKKIIKVLQDWPAQSPDMNIIEHVWGRMKEEAWKTKPKNLDELWEAWYGSLRFYYDQNHRAAAGSADCAAARRRETASVQRQSREPNRFNAPSGFNTAITEKLTSTYFTASRRQQRPPGGGGGGGKSHNLHQQQQQQQPPPQQQQLQQQQTSNQTQQHGPDHQSEGSNAKHGGRGYQQGRGSHHGYSQNRRWHQHHKQQANSAQGSRNTKEGESVKEEQEHGTERARDGPAGEHSKKEGKTEGGKVSLLQSSKERLRRRLKDKEDIPVATVGPQRNRMDKLLEILNSMRSNSSGVEGQLTSFMEEAQNSADSEETLCEIVQTIYRKAVSDRSFAATAAKLCDKMALFMVEGTKFRSLLLNMLQRDFTRRDELQQTDVECWLGFITFLCEVFGTMRSSTGEPFRVLVCPIYTCLREVLVGGGARGGMFVVGSEVFGALMVKLFRNLVVLEFMLLYRLPDGKISLPLMILRALLIAGVSGSEGRRGPLLLDGGLEREQSPVVAPVLLITVSEEAVPDPTCCGSPSEVVSDPGDQWVLSMVDLRLRWFSSSRSMVYHVRRSKQPAVVIQLLRVCLLGDWNEAGCLPRGRKPFRDRRLRLGDSGNRGCCSVLLLMMVVMTEMVVKTEMVEVRVMVVKVTEMVEVRVMVVEVRVMVELQSAGRLLEEQLPEMMTELLAAVRDKMLCPSESQLTRSLLMEVIELHAHHWSPLEALTTQYYNRTIQKLTA
ncbi:hypothetical protein NFI96_013121, partial [Prochilodus magdalenae]